MDRTRGYLVLGLIALVAFCAQGLFLDSLHWHDKSIADLAEVLRDRWGVHPVDEFSRASPYLGVLFVAVGVAVAFTRGARIAQVAEVLAVFVVGLLLAGGLKLLFDRTRPGEPMGVIGGDSYPSGHVANALLCVGTALRLTTRRSNDRRVSGARVVVALAGTLFVVAVASTRIFLGRHWLTDVTAALLFAIAFLGLTRGRRDRAPLVPFTVALLAILSLWLVAA